MAGGTEESYAALAPAVADDDDLDEAKDDLDSPTRPRTKSSGRVIPRRRVSIEDAIEEVGIGRTQYVLLVICGLTFCSDAAEVTFLSYVTEVLRCDWGITEEQESMLTSIVFVGMLVGSPFMGFLADKIGRRIAFLFSSVIICVFGFLTALCQNLPQLIAVRAVVGFGVSGLPVGFDILAEALPTTGRGRFLLYIEYFWTLGSIYVNLCAWLVLDSLGWRVFTCLAAVPTLIASLGGYWFLPESPRWLFEVSREKEALVVVNQWIAANGGEMKIASLAVDPDHEEVGCTALCKRRKLRFVVVVMGLVWFAFGVAYYGVVMLLPRVFENPASGGEEEASQGPCSGGASFDFKDLGVSVAAEVVGVAVAVCLIDSPGRAATQAIFYSLCAASAFALSFKSLPQTLLLGAGSMARMSAMGASCATWVHTPELFPTRVRTTAHGFMNICSRIGAFMAPWLIMGDFVQIREDILTGMLITGAIAAAAGLLSMQLPETAGAEMHDAAYDSTVTSDGDDDSFSSVE